MTTLAETDSPQAKFAGEDNDGQRSGKRRIKVNAELRFIHEVLGLNYLHFGLWDDDPLSLAGLKVAQQRYAATLCDWVPAGVERILDVGCGTGQGALELTERGYEVEGLSPDPYQQKVFTRRTGLPFHLTRFQDFEPPTTFDLALMSESAQYIHLEGLFPAFLRVAPGGHLLVCDYFWLPDAEEHASRSGHRMDEFLTAATTHGLEVERRKDITDLVTPTFDLATDWLDRFVYPTVRIGLDSASSRRPRLFKLGRRFVDRQVARLDLLRRKLDSAEFKRAKTYQTILLRQREAA